MKILLECLLQKQISPLIPSEQDMISVSLRLIPAHKPVIQLCVYQGKQAVPVNGCNLKPNKCHVLGEIGVCVSRPVDPPGRNELQ